VQVDIKGTCVGDQGGRASDVDRGAGKHARWRGPKEGTLLVPATVCEPQNCARHVAQGDLRDPKICPGFGRTNEGGRRREKSQAKGKWLVRRKGAEHGVGTQSIGEAAAGIDSTLAIPIRNECAQNGL